MPQYLARKNREKYGQVLQHTRRPSILPLCHIYPDAGRDVLARVDVVLFHPLDRAHNRHWLHLNGDIFYISRRLQLPSGYIS